MDADALSRLPVELDNTSDKLMSLVVSTNQFSNTIMRLQTEDPELRDILLQLGEEEGAPNIPFKIVNDMLYFHKYDGTMLLVIPQAAVPELLELYHAHELSAHMSRDRLYTLLRKQYYWKGMFQDISKWISACPKCSSVKTNIPRAAGLLQPIVTTHPFEMIAMDVMGPLTTSSDGYKYLLNIVDVFSSWPESIPLKTLTAEETTIAFQKIITRHSCPKKVITDQGTNFMSSIFSAICRQYDIHHIQSSAYHHQTIGKVERFHKFMENSLSTLVKRDQTDWPRMVDSCLFVYRTTFNRSLDEIPFFLIFGRDPNMPQDLMVPNVQRSRREIKSEDLEKNAITTC